MRSLVACAVVLSVSLGVSAGPAWAQAESREGIALQNQILELRRDIQALRDQGGRGPAPGAVTTPQRPAPGGGEITTQLLDRVSTLEDQSRRLNGRIDETDNSSQRRSADLAKQLADLQFRLDNGAAAPGATPAPRPPGAAPAPVAVPVAGAAPAAVPAAPVKRTPALALQEGNAALARRDYAAADAAAREVLAAGKTQPAAYDAQFLLAQAASGQRNFPAAAVAYNDAYDRNRQGTHAQDSLLGLASSLSALGEKRSACVALDTLRQQFPSPRPDIAQRAALTRTQSGCP
jgi:TolA-binding protein